MRRYWMCVFGGAVCIKEVYVSVCSVLSVRVVGVAHPGRMSADGWREKWKGECSGFFSHKGNNDFCFFYSNAETFKKKQHKHSVSVLTSTCSSKEKQKACCLWPNNDWQATEEQKIWWNLSYGCHALAFSARITWKM